MRPTDRPFGHIVDALRRANSLSAKKPTQKSDDDEDEKTQAEDEQDEDDKPVKKKKAKPEIEDQSDEGDEPKDEGEDSEDRLSPSKPKGLTPAEAAMIARRILRAGEKRRAQAPPELPTNRTARLIILNGMRRRNEISDDEYERLARG